MAFPYIFESNFEAGTNAEWDSESDTGSLLNYPHYSKLSGYNATIVGPIVPYRGAWVAEWNLGDTNDHTLIAAAIAIADTVTRYTRLYLFPGKNLTATADDTFSILELQGTANAQESVIALKIVAATNALTIGVGQTQATASFATQPLTRGKWVCVELLTTVQTGGTGVSTLYLDGAQVATVTTITNTAVLRGVLGTQDTLSTTTGHLFIDRFAFDSTRFYPDKQQFPLSIQLTKSAHVFLGAGWIDSTALLSATGSYILYDTDTANANNSEAVLDLDQSRGVTSYDGGAYFERGCYASIATSTRVEVKLFASNADRRRYGPNAYGGAGAIRQYGNRRSVRAQNA